MLVRDGLIMKRFLPRMSFVLLTVAQALAAPSIQQTGNAFGLRPDISIHTGIARGGLMAILGDELGPDSEVTAEGGPDPALGGVSVALNMSDGSYALPITSASRTRVVALVSAEVPAGNGTVTVTYSGSATRAAPVQIVNATFG